MNGRCDICGKQLNSTGECGVCFECQSKKPLASNAPFSIIEPPEFEILNRLDKIIDILERFDNKFIRGC